jgi:tetratricopeptide (TPR) repeat protein
LGRWLAPVAAAAAVLLFLQPWKADTRDLSSLVNRDALSVRITRDFPVDGSFEAIRRQALENYRDAKWSDAELKFHEALVLREGDGEMRLYLGSTYLLSAKYQEALAPLRLAADDNQNPRVLRNEALWVLGNAYLGQNNAKAADAILRELAIYEVPLREEAQRVLSSLE